MLRLELGYLSDKFGNFYFWILWSLLGSEKRPTPLYQKLLFPLTFKDHSKASDEADVWKNVSEVPMVTLEFDDALGRLPGASIWSYSQL